jgi:hypothetical protein
MVVLRPAARFLVRFLDACGNQSPRTAELKSMRLTDLPLKDLPLKDLPMARVRGFVASEIQ